MRMSEAELQKLVERNPNLKIRDYKKQPKRDKKSIPKPKKVFESENEENYYNSYVYPMMLAGEITDCTLHKTFEITPVIHHNGKKYPAYVYTPDFILTFKDGRVRIIEIKGSTVKGLQRDYHLRRSLFIEKHCIPNGWLFEEIIIDDKKEKGSCRNDKS